MKQRNLITLVVAALVGAGLGALLGFGPLLRYKSEGVLNMDMSTTEYKRFAELANDRTSLSAFAAQFPPPRLDRDEFESFSRTVMAGAWHKAIAKISRNDVKEVSEAALKQENDAEKEIEKEKEKEKEISMVKVKKDNPVYFGLRLTHISSDPKQAAEIAIWLGNYFREVAARESARDLVARWGGENRKFNDRAQEYKLKYQFESAQAKERVVALKKIMAAYPSASSEPRQVVNVRQDNEKFISPMGQLVGAESEIIKVAESIRKLDREVEQQIFMEALIRDADTSLVTSRSGGESIKKIAELIAAYTKKIKTDAEREKLLSFAADLSQISAQYLTQAQFIAPPSVPSRSENPAPKMYILLGAVLSALLAALYCWRDALIKLWKQEESADAALSA